MPTKREKIAARALKRPRLRKGFEDAWYMHARMFGEIMEPAFKDDTASRLELVSALNYLSRDEYRSAMSKLERLHKFCVTDEDFAAWFFFMGVCFVRLGMRDQATVLLSESAKREPAFYMVYLMLARCLHEGKLYETALSAYAHSLDCVMNAPARDEVPGVRRDMLLGSLHGNMAACCVMMRLYDEAEYELYEAESLGYDPPMLNLTWAMLCAATDRKAQAREKMADLRGSLPETEARSVLTVEEIISGKNPRFTLQKIDVPKLEGFWKWFGERELFFRTGAKSGFTGIVCRELDAKLYEIFGYRGETVHYVLGEDGKKLSLSFFDNYSLTYEIWLERLVDIAPAELKKHWSFYRTH